MAVDQTANIVDRTDAGIALNDLETAATALTDVDNDFRNDGNIIAIVFNGDASPHTATLKSQPDPFGRGGATDTDNDEAVTIAAGDFALFPFMNMAMFNSTGVARITVDAITSMKLLLVRIKKFR